MVNLHWTHSLWIRTRFNSCISFHSISARVYVIFIFYFFHTYIFIRLFHIRALGYPDNVGTYGLVSGLWTSMVALGFFIGATSGGLLSHFLGLQMGTMFIIG